MFNVFTMNEFERELAVAEKAYDIAISEIAYMEAMIDSKLIINMAKSELKVMQESSAESCVGDLAYLFNEAAKEANAQSEGIFAKIKTSVLNFITSVWNSIQKLWSHQDTEAYKKMMASKQKYTAPCNIGFFMNTAEEINGLASGGVAGAGSKLKSVATKIGAAAGITIGALSVKGIYDAIKTQSETPTECTGGQLAQWNEQLKKLNIFTKFFNSTKNMNDAEEPAPTPDADVKDENKADNSGSWLAKLMQLMTSFGSKITKFIESVASKFKNGKTGEDGNASGEGQNPGPANGKGGTDTQGAGIDQNKNPNPKNAKGGK